MERVKEILFSQRGMAVVNTLLFLALLLRGRGIIFAAYLVWIVYLGFCVKNAPSKAVRTAYAALIVFAAAMITVNLWMMLRLNG